ncbi:DUF1289 domain-containing protein [Melaminivora suipulveris]|uniref:DUF1289 domain-containing protein n=1 Tax=Melaminivora suipulveris TaxID=2109913 RepID=A0A2R3QDG6_9BURK|nr:DUF1289 domain-containing protein [Melaminivora suipulveris]AVO49810.1 DUF1289 domain-containing protein [Melaminivora suipulveris]
MNTTKLIAEHAYKLTAEGLFDPNSADAVPSPCVSVCRMTPDRSHCQGCFRTIDEIRAWSRAGSGERRAIWAALLGRAGVAVPEELQQA